MFDERTNKCLLGFVPPAVQKKNKKQENKKHFTPSIANQQSTARSFVWYLCSKCNHTKLSLLARM